ncbi:MAG: hypothetical protein KGI41_00350 [Patescibacteria group bacterium]|nr:hypothetical protein [Patescibacteria group bacterium]
MKTFALGTLFSVLALVGLGGVAHAQMMYGNGSGYGPGMMGAYYGGEAASTTASTTDSGDAAGAALLQKLSSGQTTCASLTESDFAALGDYFMGSMMGSYHEQADQYMTQSLGAQGDEAMHVAMGERLSGCNPSAPYPNGAFGSYPPARGGWGMMNGWYPMGYGYSPLGWLGNALLVIFAIIGVIALARWALHLLVHGR